MPDQLAVTGYRGLSPTCSQHQAVDARANSHQGKLLVWLEELLLGSYCQGDRQGDRAGVAQPGETSEVVGFVELKRLKQGSSVSSSDLVTDRAVDIPSGPARLGEESLEGLLPGTNSLSH